MKFIRYQISHKKRVGNRGKKELNQKLQNYENICFGFKRTFFLVSFETIFFSYAFCPF
jgi:hypothetical protein